MIKIRRRKKRKKMEMYIHKQQDYLNKSENE